MSLGSLPSIKSNFLPQLLVDMPGVCPLFVPCPFFIVKLWLYGPAYPSSFLMNHIAVMAAMVEVGKQMMGQAIVLHHTFGLKGADPLHASLECHVWSCMVPTPTSHQCSMPHPPPHPPRGIKKREGQRGPGPGYKKEEDRLAAVSFCSHGPCCVPACQHCPVCIHGLMQGEELTQGERGLPDRPEGTLQKRSCPDSDSRRTPQTVSFSALARG